MKYVRQYFLNAMTNIIENILRKNWIPGREEGQVQEEFDYVTLFYV